MPMHDWTRVDPSIYHSFHQGWITELTGALNLRLPATYYALQEAAAGGFVSDVLALQLAGSPADSPAGGGGTATLTQARVAPATTFSATAPVGKRPKKSVVAIRHAAGDRAVAFVELVSPGNKSSQDAFGEFIGKSVKLVRRRIHLLLVDPFPPGPRDPKGIHPPLWRRLGGRALKLPADKPLTFAAYEAAPTANRVYLERLAVGDPVPDMPVFLAPGEFVTVPLRETYDAAFAAVPSRWRDVIAPPAG